MWVEELKLDNIRCFKSVTLRFKRPDGSPYKWITFLSENGGGKSTALQALGLLLAGPEGAQKLLPRPMGWVRDERTVGKLAARIHQDDRDPGQYGTTKVRKAFGYSYSLTGTQPITVNQRLHTEPSILPSGQRVLSWLRQNAFLSKGHGWFGVGYGAFRRLTRSTQVLIPTLDLQARFTNFSTQFNESEPLSIFERWMIFLDYRIHKQKDKSSERKFDLGVEAINRVLPQGSTYSKITGEGRILFSVGGSEVPTVALSDGYRSILAFVGDLVWRLMLSFPKSMNPMEECGVVLVDEMDIHLHPLWQRIIPGRLRELFPNVQFVVATHSPLVAAGAGRGALTLRFHLSEKQSLVEEVPNIATQRVDTILQSPAFGLVSPFSPETEEMIKRYDDLVRKHEALSQREKSEYQFLLEFMEHARPFGGPPKPDSLLGRIEAYAERALT